MRLPVQMPSLIDSAVGKQQAFQRQSYFSQAVLCHNVFEVTLEVGPVHAAWLPARSVPCWLFVLYAQQQPHAPTRGVQTH